MFLARSCRAVTVVLTMDEVDETYVLQITRQVFSSSVVTNEKKLKLTREDVNVIRTLLNQINGSQQLLHNVLVRIFSMCV